MSVSTAVARSISPRGIKRSCANNECGRRFYDLNALPKPCPYCGTVMVEPPEIIPSSMTSNRSSKYKVYKLQQDPVRADDTDVPVIEVEADEETVDDAADAGPGDETLEIEEDDEDLTIGVKDQGEV